MTTRRYFLKRSLPGAGAAAGMWNQSLRVSGQSRKLPDVQVAIIGTGQTGQRIARSIVAKKLARIAAVADVDQVQLMKVAKLEPDAMRFTDFRKLFDEVGNRIDAVMVATPAHWNAIVALHAFAQKQMVYMETPQSHDVHESNILFKVSREAGVIHQTANPLRTAIIPDLGPLSLEVRNAVKNIGKLNSIHLTAYPAGIKSLDIVPAPPPGALDYDLWCGRAPKPSYSSARVENWRWFWSYGSGFLGDFMLRLLDFAIDVAEIKLGAEVVVSSSGGKIATTGIDAPDTQSVSFRLNKELRLVCQFRARLFPENIRRSPPSIPFYAEFHGSSGSVTLNHQGVSISDGEGQIQKTTPFISPNVSAPYNDLKEFVDRIKTGKRSLDLTGHSSTLLCHLGNIAWRVWDTTRGENKHLVYDVQRNSFGNLMADKFLARQEYRKGFSNMPDL